MHKDLFEEYNKVTEPEKYYKKYAWKTAIGLQQVDGLETSQYLLETAQQNIEGRISFAEAKERIDSYYQAKSERIEIRTKEADVVSARIAEILSEESFSFSPEQFLAIHRRLFTGIYKHAGRMRDYDITKDEWVLNGDTVTYGSAYSLKEMLDYDFKQEKSFSYKGLPNDDIISHLARFTANLWQIHPFGEGNTRTTAVFLIKYLSTLGYDVTNDVFAENSWYFRNALVRANYTNIRKEIYETTEFLEAFLRNLLFSENNKLKNRELRIPERDKTNNLER